MLTKINDEDLPKPVHFMKVQPWNWSLYLFDDRHDHHKFVNMTRSHTPLAWEVMDSCNAICSCNRNNKEVVIGVFGNHLPELVHEVTHAVFRILETVGEPLRYDSELIPYTIEHLFGECRDALNAKAAEELRTQ